MLGFLRADTVRFPLQLPAHPLKRRAKVALGRLACALLPRRAQALREHRKPYDGGVIDNLMTNAMAAEALRTGTVDQLRHIQDDFWATGSAAHWHERFDDRWEHFKSRSPELLAALDAELRSGRIHSICEIGCGNGIVLTGLSERHPQIRRCLGLDLSASQVAINQQRRKPDAHTEFRVANALEWIPEHLEAGTLYLATGALEYFQQEALSALLKRIRSQGPVAFAIVEPIAEDFDLARERESRPYGMELSFSHPYPYLFERAGYRLASCTVGRLVDTPYPFVQLLACAD
jgi:SAM-dependent methyltransferase